MQYLLTEEEYDALNKEDNSKAQQLSIENMELKTVLMSFVDSVDELQVAQLPQFMGERQLTISVALDKVPNYLLELLEGKYRGRPKNPFRTH